MKRTKFGNVQKLTRALSKKTELANCNFLIMCNLTNRLLHLTYYNCFPLVNNSVVPITLKKKKIRTKENKIPSSRLRFTSKQNLSSHARTEGLLALIGALGLPQSLLFCICFLIFILKLSNIPSNAVISSSISTSCSSFVAIRCLNPSI